MFFADAQGALFRFGAATRRFERMGYDNVYLFFVTADRLFVIPKQGADIDVLYIDGTLAARVRMEGASVHGGLILDGGDIYLTGEGFELIRIDGDFNVHHTGVSLFDARLTVRGGRAYRFSNGGIEEIGPVDQ